MTDNTTEYVFNGVLVVPTGRVAFKDTTRQTLRASQTIKEKIIEVVPVDIEEGTWKRWVAESELFVVQQ